MSDELEQYLHSQPATPERPLQGMTVLLVEDSRYASEAVRLLCLRSGARIRRADCLAAARRHLRVYRPTVVIVDLGLPDGSGNDLIRELSKDVVRVGVLLATSGDDGLKEASLAAGADGFLAKPIDSLAAFQRAILSKIPQNSTPHLQPKLREIAADLVEPDVVAYCDDLSHVVEMMRSKMDAKTQAYLAQFLSTIARSARDEPLEKAAQNLGLPGTNGGLALEQVTSLVESRLAEHSAI